MEDRRRVTTVRQLELLVEFLESHRDFALGRVRSKEARAFAARLWTECSELLNAEGPARTGKEWAKVWNDLKCRVRGKLVNINANQRATGSGPNNAPNLTPLEEKVANILGRDVGPIPNVRQDQFLVEPEVSLEVEQVNLSPPANTEREYVSTPIIIVNEHNTLSPPAPPVIAASPVPSLIGQVPTPSPSRGARDRLRGRRRTERSTHQPTARIPRSTSALDESRSMILRIEEMKARTALLNAEAFQSFGQSLRILALSVDRLSRKFCGPQELAGAGAGAGMSTDAEDQNE